MEPKVVVFTLKADPNPVERLGAFLPDGSIVDLQSAHVSMRGHPHPLLRDRTAYRVANAEARGVAADVLSWVNSQRPPGTALKPDLARIVDEMPEAGAPPNGRRGPP